MAKITREEAIEYLNGLGDPVDWDNSENNHTGEPAWTLSEIRAEVLRGDEYDGMALWQSILENYNAEDIQDDHIS